MSEINIKLETDEDLSNKDMKLLMLKLKGFCKCEYLYSLKNKNGTVIRCRSRNYSGSLTDSTLSKSICPCNFGSHVSNEIEVIKMFDINKVDEIIDGYADTILFNIDNYRDDVSPENVKALANLISARSKYGENGAGDVVYTLSNKTADEIQNEFDN